MNHRFLVVYTYRSYESDYARLALGTSDEIIDLWVHTLKGFYKNS